MNKSAIVTGVAGGIGYATAAKLLDNGFSVTGMDIAPEMGRELKGDFTYFSGDLSRAGDRKALIDAAIAHCGRIDALVNVAGVAPKVRNDLLQMTEESYDFVMNINTKGTLFLTQAAAKEMIKND